MAQALKQVVKSYWRNVKKLEVVNTTQGYEYNLCQVVSMMVQIKYTNKFHKQVNSLKNCVYL